MCLLAWCGVCFNDTYAALTPPQPNPHPPKNKPQKTKTQKDNDLTIAELAAANAADILRVQPSGPYLLGGHSYGGAVAVQIAALLEEWGHDVGLVLVR